MGKSEKQIKTNLPTNINPINTNYHEPDQSQATQSIDGLILTLYNFMRDFSSLLRNPEFTDTLIKKLLCIKLLTNLN